MRTSVYSIFLFVFWYLPISAQQPANDYSLKKSLKQDGLQFQFTVLSDDQRGVNKFDPLNYYYWFKAQRILSTQGGASGQLLHGSFEAYYENKQLAQQGRFSRGLKDGTWYYWRPNGVLQRYEHWQKGLQKGETKFFNEDGKSEQLIRLRKKRIKVVQGDSSFTFIRRNCTFDLTDQGLIIRSHHSEKAFKSVSENENRNVRFGKGKWNRTKKSNIENSSKEKVERQSLKLLFAKISFRRKNKSSKN